MKLEKTYSYRHECLDADIFQNKSRLDTEHDKTYSCILSSMFLIKNHQRDHLLKSQNKNLKFS